MLPAGAVARLGSKRWRMMSEPRTMTLSPDGSILAITTEFSNVQRFEIRTGRRLAGLGCGFSTWGVDSGAGMAFSADGKRIAVTEMSQEKVRYCLSVRDTVENKELLQIAYTRKDDYEPVLPPQGSSGQPSVDSGGIAE